MGTIDKKSARYVRVSSVGQNTDRQEQEKRKTDLTFTDKISGSIAFAERPNARKLLKQVVQGSIKEVLVDSIDRLGRNTQDILTTVNVFTKHGVNVVSEKEGLHTLVNGKESPTAKMVLSIMASIAQFELERIKERQREGIAQAKKRGAYENNGGKKPALTNKQFLNKSKNAKCLKLLNRGYSLRLAASESGISVSTAQKVKSIGMVLV